MKKLVLLLLCAMTVSAYSISDFPYFFAPNGTFNALYVVGEETDALDVVSATLISTSLARFNVNTTIGTSRIDSEIGNITARNAIVIGSPCENTAAAQLEGFPNPCFAKYGGSVGYIKLFENNGRVQLLITGLTPEDRHAAAKFFAQTNVSLMKTKEYVLSTNTKSVPPFFQQPNVTVSSPNTSLPVNNTMTVVEPQKNVAPEKKEPPKVAKYESLKEMPKKKGAWARFWGWLKSIFT